MPIQTDLSVSPYFDDFDENKDYYKVLFRPGVSVQTRELNQLQTMLQKQVERFGDNIFKKGTIVDGCDISFHANYPYAKIRDIEVDGAPVNVSQYVGYFVKNEANIAPLIAAVQTVVDGFESRSPDLKSLYLRYTSTGYANIAGVSTEQTTFAANQTLTVYNPENPIEKIISFNNSAGFSNTDTVAIVSAIAIQNSTGGTSFTNNFFVGDHVNDGTANAQIVAIDTTTNTSAVILRLKPRAVDLKAANSDLWSFYANTTIQSTNTTPSDVATIAGVIGSGAQALMRTGAAGDIQSITVTSSGSEYYVLPTVSIASPGATTTQIATANLVPQTFLTKVTVANDSVFSIGSGYAMTVGKGVIYQKGYFSRVNEHLVIVDKYSSSPSDVVVGFDTTEEVINSNQDPALLDNATGEPNETAPGADRLKLTPMLVVKTKPEAEANTDFFSIAEFSNGFPYKQNRQTVYNIIGNEMARRTFEESGNYVLDPFILNTKPANTIANEVSTFGLLIDPGVAYVNGMRVETVRNFETSVQKGTDTFISTNANISLNYGSYVRVNELSGVFKFNIGDQVDLYAGAGRYISAGNAGVTPFSGGLGTLLGTARIRSLVYESGTPGTANCVYRLYLFDIRLATARNFGLIRSIFYNGTNKGVADTITEGGVTVLKDTNLSSLLYSAGRPAVKAGNTYTYVYRTINDTGDIKLAANGIITFASAGSETFPYTPGSTLSTAQENEITVVPLANVEVSANVAGSVSCNATSPQVNGTSTTFTSSYQAGDFIKIANSTVNIVRQIDSVANDTVLTLTSNGSAFTGANTKVFFPANVPISLLRSNRSANVDVNANNITINMGASVNVQTNVAVAYNVRSANVTPVVKTVNRNRFIRMRLANNATTNTGPWALGVPDVFRLGKVYVGPNATFTDSDTVNVSDVTSQFYIDHNQNENYYGISYLYRKPGAATPITTSDYLLVKFDYFTDSGEGLKAPGASGTYAINDGVNLAGSSTTINTLEIPEVFSDKGDYYDLRDNFDFRPKSANTVVPNAAAASAPINPTEPSNSARFTTADKKFPAPDSNLTGVVEYYQGRIDRVVIDDSGNFHVIKGTPGTNEAPSAPNNALTINILKVPPYPSQPYRLSTETVDFIDSSMANERFTGQRLNNYRVTAPIDSKARRILQPRGFTMADIGALERRISDIEYYVSYTLVEAMVQKREIPSSANSTIARAKFGFFVDSFDNYNYSDITNPGYSASVVDGRLAPRVNEINLPLKSVVSTDSISLPFVEREYIAQKQATDGPLLSGNTGTGGTNTSIGTIVVTPNPPTSANTTTAQTIVSIIQNNKTTARSDTGSVFEEFFYTFSEQAGPVEMYVNSRDNNIAAEIFQSQNAGGPWISTVTSATAAAITNSDVASKGITSLNGGRRIEHLGSLIRKSYGPVGNFLEDQFKLLWSHSPTNGRYYKIRIYKGRNHGSSGQSGTFGYKLFYPTDTTINTSSQVNGFTPTVNYNLDYAGSFLWYNTGITNSILPTFDIQYLLNNAVSGVSVVNPTTVTTSTSQPVAGEQIFNITATGLKPNTEHKFFFEGIDITGKTKQIGGTLGSGLTSDSNGKIEFTLYYHPDIESLTSVSQAAANIERAAGVKSVRVVSNDGTSYAESTLQLQQYVRDAIEATPPPPTAITQPAPSVAPPSPYSGLIGGRRLIGAEFDTYEF